MGPGCLPEWPEGNRDTWHPSAIANCAVPIPTGPAPITRQFSPWRGVPRKTACAPMQRVSTRASCSSESFSDFTSLLHGAQKYGFIPPSAWTPRTEIEVQQLGLFHLQLTHLPHSQYGTTEHLSPTARPLSSVPSPSATTVTPNSWPSTRG